MGVISIEVILKTMASDRHLGTKRTVRTKIQKQILDEPQTDSIGYNMFTFYKRSLEEQARPMNALPYQIKKMLRKGALLCIPRVREVSC